MKQMQSEGAERYRYMFDGFIVSTFSCPKASCGAYIESFQNQELEVSIECGSFHLSLIYILK